MPTIHFDITDVLEFARFNTTLTGIQRVLIQLISKLVNQHGANRIRLIGHHPTLHRLASWDASYFAGDYHYEQADFCYHFGMWSKVNKTALHDLCERKYGRLAGLHSARLRAKNVLTFGREFRRRGISISPSTDQVQSDDAEKHISPGDTIFMGGATWGFIDSVHRLAEIKRKTGARLCSLIYDLIPLLSQEHVEPGHIAVFEHWLKTIAKHTDLFLTISEFTKADLDDWLRLNAYEVPSRALPLAHQFADWPRGLVPSETRVNIRNAARLPYALCVGTIESRKNVWTLANVWRDIHSKLGTATPRLIFAGKHGWLKDDFDDFIRGTGSLYGYIRIVERPTDDDLAYLYKNCLFLIFPSYKEGWGLPIGECLWFGRPVICSNTSSMPEAGGSLADYIDPNDPHSIKDAVLKMITNPSYREHRASQIAAAKLRDWSDVANDLYEALMGPQPVHDIWSVETGFYTQQAS